MYRIKREAGADSPMTRAFTICNRDLFYLRSIGSCRQPLTLGSSPPARQSQWRSPLCSDPSGQPSECREAGFKTRRWVVEPAHSWLNRFRRIPIRSDTPPNNHIPFFISRAPSSPLEPPDYQDRFLVLDCVDLLSAGERSQAPRNCSAIATIGSQSLGIDCRLTQA